MADPQGNVNQHLIAGLLNRRESLRRERRMLKQAEGRLAEIAPELDIIDAELKARGHIDAPKPAPVPDSGDD